MAKLTTAEATVVMVGVEEVLKTLNIPEKNVRDTEKFFENYLFDYGRAISKVLGICLPEVVLYAPEPGSKDIASGGTDGNRVLVVFDLKKTPADYILTLAHELRHVWQVHECPELVKGHKRSNELTDSKTGYSPYAMQPAEVDAMAFARLVAECVVGEVPVYEDPALQAAVERRSAEIEPTLDFSPLIGEAA